MCLNEKTAFPSTPHAQESNEMKVESLNLGLWGALERKPISQAGLFLTFSSSFHGNQSHSYVNPPSPALKKPPTSYPFPQNHMANLGSLVMYFFLNWNLIKIIFLGMLFFY